MFGDCRSRTISWLWFELLVSNLNVEKLGVRWSMFRVFVAMLRFWVREFILIVPVKDDCWWLEQLLTDKRVTVSCLDSISLKELLGGLNLRILTVHDKLSFSGWKFTPSFCWRRL